MKKLVLLVAAVFSCLLPAAAGDAEIISKIEKSNSNVGNIEASFSHRNVKNGKTSNFSGTYYYSGGKLAMVYTVDSEALVVNDSHLYLKHGKKVTKGDIRNNARMRGFAGTLINCIKGNISAVAKDNNADWSLTQDSSSYVVTVKARKKASKGYSKIVLRYRKSDCLLTGITLEEFNGTVNEYKLSSPKTGGAIPVDVFKIPSK